MFTGIIEEVGKVKSISKHDLSVLLNIQCNEVLENTKLGDSIAVNGVCLTVTKLSSDGFVADVMNETLSKSSLGQLSMGDIVNLERAMAVGGRFGGHIVSGHIDGVGKILRKRKDGIAIVMSIATESDLLGQMINKGSIAIDGVSLTIMELTDTYFSVSLIPHTMKETILYHKDIGGIVNLETDVIGKYVQRLMGIQKKADNGSDISMSYLAEHGFI